MCCKGGRVVMVFGGWKIHLENPQSLPSIADHLPIGDGNVTWDIPCCWMLLGASATRLGILPSLTLIPADLPAVHG